LKFDGLGKYSCRRSKGIKLYDGKGSSKHAFAATHEGKGSQSLAQQNDKKGRKRQGNFKHEDFQRKVTSTQVTKTCVISVENLFMMRRIFKKKYVFSPPKQ
jgi:hypothetical protein